MDTGFGVDSQQPMPCVSVRDVGRKRVFAFPPKY